MPLSLFLKKKNPPAAGQNNRDRFADPISQCYLCTTLSILSATQIPSFGMSWKTHGCKSIRCSPFCFQSRMFREEVMMAKSLDW